MSNETLKHIEKHRIRKEGKQEVLVYCAPPPCCAPPLHEVQQEDVAVSMCADAGDFSNTVFSHSYKLLPQKAFKRVEVPSKLAEKRVKFDSMDLVIEAMTMLTKQLREGDTVSLVTYGGGVRIILDGAKASDKKMIISTLQKLKAGGYTPGGAGIVEAYKLAKKHFIKKGNNRIVLITDGDFNVGASSESDLVKMIEEKRKS